MRAAMDGDAPCCCPRTWLTASISSFKTRTSCASGAPPHDQRWLLAIESVYKKLNPEMQRLFTLHFQEHRSGLDVMYELCIERSTFYAWREQILMQIAVAAVESGAMQIFYD